MQDQSRTNKIKSLKNIAILAPFLVLLLTGTGMFVLGALKPCNGLHEGSTYYNNPCSDICCQYSCNTPNNKCITFPGNTMYVIGGIMIGMGALISISLYFYKRHLVSTLNLNLRDNEITVFSGR